MGFVAREQGQSDEARVSFNKALDRARVSGHRYLEAYTLMAAGTVAVAHGQPDATDLLNAALAIAERADLGPIAAASYAWLAEYHRLTGRLDEAERLIGLAEKTAPDRDRILYEVYLILVRIRLSKSQIEPARHALGLLLARALRQAVPADGLETAATVFALQGHPKAAAVALGAATAFRESYGMPLPPVYEAAQRALEADVRATLEEPDRHIERGRGMSPSEAVRYARVCAA